MFKRPIPNIGILVALCLLPGCSSSKPAAPDVQTGPNLVKVVANEYGFQMPDSIPSGLTTFQLEDKGNQEHHLMIMRLDGGKSAADAMAALGNPEGPLPEWMVPVGGPNASMPGETSNATLVLEAGNYLAFCIIPAPDGKSHISLGMTRPFTVTPSAAQPEALPKADMVIKLGDYDFALSQPITAGRHTIEVVNVGTQPHEMVITRFSPDQGNRDLEAWGMNPGGKPAPGHAMGGVTTMAPGEHIEIVVNFIPGKYGLLCFVPDSKDGKPHFVHGMQMEFEVS